MSISPASRDVVLATFVLYFTTAYVRVSQLTGWFSRRGLYIIDLEAPFEVPRFLPQGGTFNVGGSSYDDHRSHTCLNRKASRCAMESPSISSRVHRVDV